MRLSTTLPDDEGRLLMGYLEHEHRAPAWWLRQLIRTEMRRLEMMARMSQEHEAYLSRMRQAQADAHIERQIAEARQYETL